MLATLSFHELVLGVLALIVTVAVVGLTGSHDTIPAELWALETALVGVFVGVQVPSGAQQAQQASMTRALLAMSAPAHVDAPAPPAA